MESRNGYGRGQWLEKVSAFLRDLREDTMVRLEDAADLETRRWFTVLFMDGTKRTCGHLHANPWAAWDCVKRNRLSVDPTRDLVVEVSAVAL